MAVREAIPVVGQAIAVKNAAGKARGAYRKAYGERSRPVKTSVAILSAAALIGVLGRLEGLVGLEEHKSVTAAKLAQLKLATTIAEETTVARAVAHYEGIKAADHVDICENLIPKGVPFIGGKKCSPHMASWSVSYKGDIGAKIATTKSVAAAEVYDPNAVRRDGKKGGALVVNIDENDFALDVYEMNAGKGFTTDNSPGGAIASAFTDGIKAIPGFDAKGIDHTYDGLRHMVINEAFREMAAPQGCGHLAIDLLTKPADVDADAKLEQPKSIQGLVIKNLVAADNSALELAHDSFRVTTGDINVTIVRTTGPIALPTEYTQFSNGINAHTPNGVTVPKESSIHVCQNATGMGGA
jgi:hypothetical protein